MNLKAAGEGLMNAMGNCAANKAKCGDFSKNCCQTYKVTKVESGNQVMETARGLAKQLGMKIELNDEGSICTPNEKAHNGEWTDSSMGLSFTGTCSKAKALVGGAISA